MSLQVWLPLNRDVRNLGLKMSSGLSDLGTITNYSRKSTSAESLNYRPYTSNGSISFGAWFKFNKTEISTKVNSLSYTSDATSATGNLIGNSNYGGMGLIWTTNNIYSSGSFTTLYVASAIRSNTIGIKFTGSIQIPFDEWVHLFYIYDRQGYLYLFINGELKSKLSGVAATDISTNSLFLNLDRIHAGNGPTTSIPFLVSDLRIYDHALSTKEVKEISMGCILHYPCNDILNESTVNYCPYPTPGSAVGAIGWDQSKHPNAIWVSGFGSGYNGGVSNPSKGYHAMWNIMDGIPTIVLNDKNSEIGQIHRWLGINTYDFRNYYTLSKGVTYTISFEAKSTVNGKCISGGFWYQKNGQTNGSGNFNDGRFYKYVTTEWGKYSATFTVLYDINDYYTSFYFYGYEKGSGSTNPEGTSYIRNIQIEIKDHATVYTPSSRTQALLYDVSGFDNHSTISGSLPLSATPKSAHYDKCMNIDNSGTNKNYANCTIAAPQVKAASFWLYIGDSNPINQILFVDLASNMGFGFNSIGNIISHTTTGHYIPSVFSGNTTIKNSWNHFVINHLGTSTELYLNGVKLSSTTNDGWTNNVNGFYFGRRVRTDYDYYYTGKVSDFRLFSRVLSQHDVDDLYKDSFAIDNKQNGFIYELNESGSQSTVEIKKNGQLLCSDYEEGQLLMLKMYWNGDIDEYELDYQDYYAYEGKTTIWEGQKCYIWQRYDADCEAYDYEDTDNSENIILTNTLNIKMPFNGSSPEFVAAIGLDGNECYNEPRLAMWAYYDSEGEYSGMIKLEGDINSSEVARICKNGKVTTKEIYEI